MGNLIQRVNQLGGRSIKAATKKINAMSSEEVFRHIRNLKNCEAREYLGKHEKAQQVQQSLNLLFGTYHLFPSNSSASTMFQPWGAPVNERIEDDSRGFMVS